ncbi:MAG: CpsD/CapB family tyrosine-protein kinase [Firmicutes bacterium]|nr:CpsD/CapB family tyrosine-protein kinase [Bacillota bacterium]
MISVPRHYTGRLIVLDDPKAVGSEAFRTLRTNLQFASLNEELVTISFTSTGPNEGKSVISSNLAVSIAQTGTKVILMDCDLRKPAVHRIFGLRNTVGLTTVLTGEASLESALQDTRCKNLQVLTAGPIPPNPAELLQSKAMEKTISEIRHFADKVLIDAPPVLPVADAMILASYVDGIVFVVGAQLAPKDMARRAKEQLESTNTRILGVVLNKVKYDRGSEHYYYYYRPSEQDG